MSALTASRATTDGSTTTRTAIVAAGLIGAIACAAYVSTVLFIPTLSSRDSSRLPLHLAANITATLAFIALTIALPGLAPTTRLPRWALTTSAAGCAFSAAITWTFGTYVAHASGFITDAQAQQIANTDSVYAEIFTIPKILLCMVGFVALAITGWRRRAFSRGASVLLALAAVVSLLAPPWPGGVLAGLALAWVARTARTAEA